MSIPPLLAALLALAAAFAALPRAAPAPMAAARVLSVLAALAMVPTLDEASAWPAAMMVGGAAVFATPLPCFLGAAAALAAALAAPVSEVPLAQVLAASSLAAVAASLDAETGARLRSGLDAAWPSVVAALGLCLALATLGEGRVLAWHVVLATPEARVTLPGAGLVAGLTLLVTLGGALALAAHLLTPAAPSLAVRRLGQKALVLGGALGVLTLGYVVYRGWNAREMLGAGAPGLAGVLLGTGVLLASLFLLLADPTSGEPEAWLRHAAWEARIGAGLAVAAAGMAGFEAWLREGSYATPASAAAASAALLGLAVLEPTRLTLLRKALLMVALLFVWAPR